MFPARSTFFHYGLGLEGSNAAASLETDSTGEVSLTLLASPQVAFHYELSFFESGATTVEEPQGGGKVRSSILI